MIKEKAEKSKTLADGTVITASRDPSNGRIEVTCRKKDARDDSASFELREDGLWGIRIKKLRTTLGEGGCTVDYWNIELGYGENNDKSIEWLQAFRNSAPIVVDWVGEMIEKDAFVPPTSMLEIVQL